MASLNQFACRMPLREACDIPTGWAVGREAAFRAIATFASRARPLEKVWTDRVRGSGRFRRKKQMWHEMMGDVPGIFLVPDPSLGGAPQAEGPTAHRLGAP